CEAPRAGLGGRRGRGVSHGGNSRRVGLGAAVGAALGWQEPTAPHAACNSKPVRRRTPRRQGGGNSERNGPPRRPFDGGERDVPYLPRHEIKVGARHRRDVGDLDELAASIDAYGLIQPLVLAPDQTLVAGFRRLQALKKIGRTEAPVYVAATFADALAALHGEFAENTCRKDFTPLEAVAIGQALEEQEREEARGRQGRLGKRRSACSVRVTR